MEVKNINLQKKDFISFFVYRHKKNFTIYAFPIVFVMIFILMISTIVKVGFNLGVVACLFTIIIGITYIYAINKTCKSYANQPFDIELDKGVYKIIRNKKVTFKSDLEKFAYYDETKNYFYLFVTKNNTFVLPKSAFDEENLAFLSTQIHKKMKKRKSPVFICILSTILGLSAIGFVVSYVLGLF